MSSDWRRNPAFHLCAALSQTRRPRGVCLGSDGKLWLLSDADDMRGWYAAAAGSLDAIELARILVRYHGEGGHGQTFIDAMDTIGDLLEPEQIAALPEFCLPRVQRGQPGALTRRLS